MNWTDYQALALTFVSVKGDLRQYVAFGLLAEVGEIAGVYAKQIRGDQADMRERLLSELGDVAWFIAVGTHCLGVPFEKFDRNHKSHKHDTWHYLTTMHRNALVLTHVLRGTGRLEPAPYEQLTDLVGAWARLILSEGFTVADVLQANLDKLAGRKARGTIGGTGDYR